MTNYSTKSYFTKITISSSIFKFKAIITNLHDTDQACDCILTIHGKINIYPEI